MGKRAWLPEFNVLASNMHAFSLVFWRLIAEPVVGMLTLRGCSWNVQHMSSQSFVVLLKPPVPLPLCYNGPSEYVSTTAQGPLLLSHFAVCMRYMYSSKNSLYVDISELTCKVSSFWLQIVCRYLRIDMQSFEFLAPMVNSCLSVELQDFNCKFLC